MKCPKCLAGTRVVDSCPSDAPETKRALRNVGEQYLGWYSRDWRVRTRVCMECKNTLRTIELPAEDMRDICLDPPPANVFNTAKKYNDLEEF